MASALYLENYLESKLQLWGDCVSGGIVLAGERNYDAFPLGIENLPQELRRNFALMRELDQRTEG